MKRFISLLFLVFSWQIAYSGVITGLPKTYFDGIGPHDAGYTDLYYTHQVDIRSKITSGYEYHKGHVMSDTTSIKKSYGQWGGSIIQVSTNDPLVTGSAPQCVKKDVFFLIGDAYPDVGGLYDFPFQGTAGIWKLEQSPDVNHGMPIGNYRFEAFIQPMLADFSGTMIGDDTKLPYVHNIEMLVEKRYDTTTKKVTEYALSAYTHFLQDCNTAAYPLGGHFDQGYNEKDGQNCPYLNSYDIPVNSDRNPNELPNIYHNYHKAVAEGIKPFYSGGALFKTVNIPDLQTAFSECFDAGWSEAKEKLAVDLWVYKTLTSSETIATEKEKVNRQFAAKSLVAKAPNGVAADARLFAPPSFRVTEGDSYADIISSARMLIDAKTNESAFIMYKDKDGVERIVKALTAKTGRQNIHIFLVPADKYLWELKRSDMIKEIKITPLNAYNRFEDPFFYLLDDRVMFFQHDSSKPFIHPDDLGQNFCDPSGLMDASGVKTSHLGQGDITGYCVGMLALDSPMADSTIALHDTSVWGSTTTLKVLDHDLHTPNDKDAFDALDVNKTAISGSNIPKSGLISADDVFYERQRPRLWFDVEDRMGLVDEANTANPHLTTIASGIMLNGTIWHGYDREDPNSSTVPYSALWATGFVVDAPVGGPGVKDTVPPYIQLVGPTDTVGGLVTVQCQATDVSPITGYEILVDGVSKSNSNIYHIDTRTYPDGTLPVECKVTDSQSNVGSRLIHMTVDNTGYANELNKPIAKLITPEGESIVSGVVDILCNISDDVAVDTAQIWIDGSIVTSNAAYIWDTTQATDAVHVVSCRAIDVNGNISTTKYNITVNNTTDDIYPPVVSVNNPLNTETVSGTVNISCSATDASGIALYGVLVDDVVRSSTSSYKWDTTTETNDVHVVQCRATDASSNSNVGRKLSYVMVDNSTNCYLSVGTKDVILRDTAAEWLGRCVYGDEHTPPTYSGNYSDVTFDDYNADWIEQVFIDGITEGCNIENTRYCPKDPGAKVQAVKLILRAKHGDTFSPDPAIDPPFDDVPLSHPDVDWIKQAKDEGITTGCDDGSNFCPSEVLTQKGFRKMLGGAF